MLMFFKKMKKNRKGYTLTELIVVVAILGILAAIGTPMIMNQIQNSRVGADDTTAAAIETAVQLCLGNETLVTNSSNVIERPSGITATIPSIIAVNMVGGAIPNPEQNGFEFYLNLTNGQVTCTASASTTVSTTLILLS